MTSPDDPWRPVAPDVSGSLGGGQRPGPPPGPSGPGPPPGPPAYGPPGYGPPGYGPPGYGPPGYGPPGYGPPGYAPYGPPPGYGPGAWGPPPARTNGLAITSMVLGIVWVYWIGSILALVFGYIAKKQIRERGESGGGMATAGIVLGWIGIGFLVLLIGLGVAGAFDDPGTHEDYGY